MRRTISTQIARTHARDRSAPPLWIVLSGVGFLLLVIFAFRVYFWHKAVLDQAKSPKEERVSMISPAERDRIDEFRDYLGSLSKTDLNSIQQGQSYFQRELLSLSVRGIDMAYLVFSDFYYQTSTEYNEQIMSSDDLLKARLDAGNSRGLQCDSYLKYLNDPKILKQDSQIQDFTVLLSKNGLELAASNASSLSNSSPSSDDNYIIQERPGYLYNHFGAVLSEALRKFLELRRDDETDPVYSADSALLISYRDLGERVILWERYLDNYPDSLVNDEADYYYHSYLETLLMGTGENSTKDSGIFDAHGVLKPELKRVYYNFKSKYPNTKSGKLIEQFYDLLLHNNFKNSRQLEDFYRQNQVKSGPGE